ncbi:MAG: hypothetical protein HY650_13510 [Acidobacteria bacterium]|nr:hypothetical protein [Acidobacteriota bacterium]
MPPPQPFKHQIIRNVAGRHGTRILVETGTHRGETIAACLGDFKTLYSIELSNELFAAAQRRFARNHKVRLRQGNSAHELPHILKEIKEPALFWLDAHYSGDGTARADFDTPIVQELQAISKHPVTGHVILIDDARLFDGTNGYPTVGAVREFITTYWPGHEFNLHVDVVVIAPASYS